MKDCSNNILQQSDYTYDAFDRRIIKSFDDDGPGPHTPTVTKTIHDGTARMANPYADFNASNALTVRYLYAPAVDFLLARRDASGTVAWHLSDHLGTIRDIVNTSGTVIDHISYSSFGTITSETSSSNGDRFKFTSREYDVDSGQYHFRARSYAPTVGRFVSPDPLTFAANDKNFYRYVANSPLRHTDPSGLIAQGSPDPLSKEISERMKYDGSKYLKAHYNSLKGMENPKSMPMPTYPPIGPALFQLGCIGITKIETGLLIATATQAFSGGHLFGLNGVSCFNSLGEAQVFKQEVEAATGKTAVIFAFQYDGDAKPKTMAGGVVQTDSVDAPPIKEDHRFNYCTQIITAAGQTCWVWADYGYDPPGIKYPNMDNHVFVEPVSDGVEPNAGHWQITIYCVVVKQPGAYGPKTEQTE